MLGILLLYFIGKRFYDLSEEFNQNKLLFTILSIVVYYGVGFLFVMIIAVLDMFVFEWGFDWEKSYGMNLLVIPFGLLAVWAFYMFLENRWKKSVVIVKDEINDIGKNIN
ncbi:hypothetical protein [Thalassobellus sediminis]|uniref:hypothetical protein n=1 Tax=Thalassobellus sediminis TaxID=3367753 RepID=UPI00378E2236